VLARDKPDSEWISSAQNVKRMPAELIADYCFARITRESTQKLIVSDCSENLIELKLETRLESGAEKPSEAVQFMHHTGSTARFRTKSRQSNFWFSIQFCTSYLRYTKLELFEGFFL